MRILRKHTISDTVKLYFLIGLVANAVVFSENSFGNEPGRPETVEVGGLVPEGSFTDINGRAINLRELSRQNKGLVIAFHSVSCPVSRQYGPTLARMEPGFRQAGLKLIIVNPHETDKPEEIKQFRAQFPADVTYILDHDDTLTNAMGARSTTEVFLVDSTISIVYRGAVDDQFTTERKLKKSNNDWLTQAIFSIGKKIKVQNPVTDPSGCVLQTDFNITTRVKEVNYHNRISRIIKHNCIHCHYSGGVGPFPLETYKDVKDHKSMISLVLKSNEMPPWPASNKFPQEHPGFNNEATLSGQEKRDLLNWLKNPQLPEGDPSLDPEDYDFAKIDWFIGKPDLIVQLPEPVELPAQGLIDYKVVDVDLKLTEDKWATQWELKPTDNSVVHHALVYLIPEKKEMTEEEKKDKNADHRHIPEFLFGYVPGFSSSMAPQDTARLIPKGTRLRFQIHYVSKGVAVKEQLRFGIKFQANPPMYSDLVHTPVNFGIKIPAGASDHIETISQFIPEDIYLEGIQPHLHHRGKSLKVELLYPDKNSMTLLDIPNWDFEWQFGYNLTDPVLAPKGSIILTTAIFDNSTENINNPDPTKTVTWGPNTEDEMFISGFDYKSKNGKRVYFPPPDTSGKASTLIKVLSNKSLRTGIFRFLDADHNGLISRKELDRLVLISPELKGRADRLDNSMKLIDTDGDNQWSLEEFNNIESFFN